MRTHDSRVMTGRGPLCRVRPSGSPSREERRICLAEAASHRRGQLASPVTAESILDVQPVRAIDLDRHDPFLLPAHQQRVTGSRANDGPPIRPAHADVLRVTVRAKPNDELAAHRRFRGEGVAQSIDAATAVQEAGWHGRPACRDF